MRPTSVALGDLNGDGRPDLAVADPDHGAIGVLLNKGNGIFAEPVFYPAGGTTSPAELGVALGDLNGDGRNDLAVSWGSYLGVSVLLNHGDGTFAAAVTYEAGYRPVGAVIGDLNGDGKADLVVANYLAVADAPSPPSTVSVLLNRGDGTFAAAVSYAAGALPTAVALGDLNGDGQPDLAVANSESEQVSVLLNNGNGTFAAASDADLPVRSTSIAIGDLDGDGKLDLAIGSLTASGGGAVTVVLNHGNATFAPPVNTSVGPGVYSIAIKDLNGDGKADLAFSGLGSGRVSVLLNRGGGTFVDRADYPVDLSLVSLAVGDLNGDSKPDLVAANEGSGNVSVFLNTGAGIFGPRSYAAGVDPRSIVAADLNGDGKLDLAVASTDGQVAVLLGNGDGAFGMAASYAAGAGPQSIAAADLNGDGKPDLAVANSIDSGQVSVLVNRGDGTFAIPVSYPAAVSYAPGAGPQSIAAGDLNGDGHADLIVANNGLSGRGPSGDVSVLLNNGDGTFAAAAAYAAEPDLGTILLGEWEGDPKLTVADLNGDGKLDVALVNHGVSLLLNQGDGTLAMSAYHRAGESPASIAVGDLNGDGKPDLAVGNRGDGTISVLLNAGDGAFVDAVSFDAGGVRSLAIADLNRDGHRDVVVTNSGNGSSNLTLLMNDGRGHFDIAVSYAAGGGARSIVSGDLNGDAKVDIALVGDSGDPNVIVFLNDAP